MKILFQIVVALFTVISSLGLLYLMATSEINFQDLRFGLFFGLFITIAAVAFFVLTRNDDNEETNPGKERVKK